MAFTFVLLYQAKLHPEIEPSIVANLLMALFANAQTGSSRARLLRTHSVVPEDGIGGFPLC